MHNQNDRIFATRTVQASVRLPAARVYKRAVCGLAQSLRFCRSYGSVVSFKMLSKNNFDQDFEFVLKNQQNQEIRIPAHKTVLGSRCAFFKRMFENQKESIESMALSVGTFEGFKEFLQLIYSKDIKLTPDHMAEVLTLINKFGATSLSSICETFIKETVTVEVALRYYDLAMELNMSESVQKHLWTMIQKRAAMIISDGSECRTNVVEKILESDFIYEVSETKLFYGLRSFAENTLSKQGRPNTPENKREIMSKYLHLIRFPRMEASDLQYINQKYAVLPTDQYEDILNYVRTGAPLTVAQHYNTKPRGAFCRYFALNSLKTKRDSISSVKINCAPETTFKCNFRLTLYNDSALLREWEAKVTIKYGSEEITKTFNNTKANLSLFWEDAIEFENMQIIVELDRYVSKIYDTTKPSIGFDNLPEGMNITGETRSFIESIDFYRVE